MGFGEVRMQINYLDLFSGVGGFTRGLLDAGFTFNWHGFSEIDKHAVKLYEGLYPTAEAMGDITKISTDELRRLSARIGGIDLITFGFPCTDLSIAGKREGLEGKRSGLFFEALRIIEAVRPACFIFENVKGLFSSQGGRDFKTILQAIADLGLYDCQWQLLNTKWFLPQNRERIYFVGLLRGQRKFGREIFPISEATGNGFSASQAQKIQHSAQCLRARDYGNYNGNFVSVGTWRDFKKPDGVIEGMREIKDGSCPTIPARPRNDGSGCPVVLTEIGYAGQRIRRLTPLECFRLQFGMKNAAIMIAKAKELNISDTQLYKMAGNAVSSPVVQCIAERLLQVEG